MYFLIVARFFCNGKRARKPDGTAVKYKDPLDSRYWYECSNGIKKRQRCYLSRQVFDERLQNCTPFYGGDDGDDEDFCKNKRATSPNGTTMKYKDPRDSSYWYECIDGIPIRYRCFAHGYVFDEGLQYCEPRHGCK